VPVWPKMWPASLTAYTSCRYAGAVALVVVYVLSVRNSCRFLELLIHNRLFEVRLCRRCVLAVHCLYTVCKGVSFILLTIAARA
jgi:hypothetical protein